MANITIVNPLTLLGREALQLLEAAGPVTHTLDFAHTAHDDEHQLAEVAGEPKLVPPLDDPGQLADADAVLMVAEDDDSPREHHIFEFMEANPTALVVVMGSTDRFVDVAAPAAGPPADMAERHLRVVHPGVVTLIQLVDCLRHFEPETATVAAVDPVSSAGRESIEQLARQAAKRLQGAEVDELIGDHVLAFNTVAVEDHELVRDAALLLPDLSVAVTRNLVGQFHGHVAYIGLSFAHPAPEHEIFETLRDDQRFTEPGPLVSSDGTSDSDQVALSLPRLSNDDRVLAITAMADGLRVGGALTAIEILQAMLS